MVEHKPFKAFFPSIKRKVAHTTVMTVMKKLADKGYLLFEKEGALP